MHFDTIICPFRVHFQKPNGQFNTCFVSQFTVVLTVNLTRCSGVHYNILTISPPRQSHIWQICVRSGIPEGLRFSWVLLIDRLTCYFHTVMQCQFDVISSYSCTALSSDSQGGSFLDGLRKSVYRRLSWPMEFERATSVSWQWRMLIIWVCLLSAAPLVIDKLDSRGQIPGQLNMPNCRCS